jgi:tetratricopeptide (TPR) repeat protein
MEVTMKRLFFIAVLGVLFFPPNISAQDSQAAKNFVKRGIERFSRGDIAGAIEHYDRALSVDPKLVDAYLNRGKARRAGGDLDGAIADYEMVRELAPVLASNNKDMVQAYVNRGFIRSNHLDLDGALSDFDHAILLDPNDAEAYFKRGRAFLIEGNLKFAIADFDKSISLDDHNPLVYAERGFAYQTQGHPDEAEKDFDKGLKLNNDLRLMLDLHLLDLQMQIREMRRRQAAIQRNIAKISGCNRPDAAARNRPPAALCRGDENLFQHASKGM